MYKDIDLFWEIHSITHGVYLVREVDNVVVGLILRWGDHVSVQLEQHGYIWKIRHQLGGEESIPLVEEALGLGHLRKEYI